MNPSQPLLESNYKSYISKRQKAVNAEEVRETSRNNQGRGEDYGVEIINLMKENEIEENKFKVWKQKQFGQ